MSLAPLDLLHFTYRSLRGNPVRSILTTIGVFMGVTAVSATLQVGSISRAIVARRLAERQAPQVTLFPDWQSSGPRAQLKQDDLEFLRQRLVGMEALSAMNWSRSLPVVFQDQQAQPDIVAVSQEYLQTSGLAIVAGRFFARADFANFRPVVVIDELLAAQLFLDQNPVGQRIYADRQPYTVIGVISSKNSRDEDEEPTGRLILSLAFHSALTGSREIGMFRIRPTRLKDLEDLGDRAEKLLMQRFPGQQFYTFNNVEDILEQQRILELTSRGLAVVGAISLLVGGVGIANIMIASVTERTAEIGLRRAIGATQAEILLQFILEAALLSLVGGAVAIVTVHALTSVVSEQFDLPYEFEAQTAGLTLGAALLVGIGASLLPAVRASRLDPVQALRSQ